MKIRWGILGAGAIAGKFAHDFKLVENGELVAVSSRSLDKAKAFSQEYDIKKAYGSYEEMLADKDIDVVYVATINTLHFTHSKLCLEYGKHVLCEKPVTVNASEALKLSEFAQSKRLFFMEAMWSVFLPAVQKAKEWYEQGLIGDIQIIQANFGLGRMYKERLVKCELGGGSLLDVGIYPLTFIEMFASAEIDNIYCSAVKNSSGIDLTLSVNIDYSKDIKASMVSSIRTDMVNDLYVYGSKGYIHIPKFWMSKEAYLKTEDSEEVFADNTDKKFLGYNFETEAVNKDILNGKLENAIMPHRRSINMMRLMDRIRTEVGIIFPGE